MRVLIVSNLYHPNGIGGAEKVAQCLAEGLVTQGHRAAVATLNPEKRYRVDDVNGVRVHYLPVKNFYFPNRPGARTAAKMLWHAMDIYNPFMATSLKRVLDAECPDVVNTHNIGGFSATAWKEVKARGLPLVHTAHDYYTLCPKCTMRRGGTNCQTICTDCRIYSGARRRLSSLVDVLTAPSRFVLDKHILYGVFPEAEKMPIYNCCERVTQTDSKFRTERRPLRFGFLGRLHPSKGVESVVRSFLDISGGRAELVIAGRGEPAYEQGLKSLANGRQGVRWLGFVPKEELLGQVDVAVVPSVWQDPAPLAVLEALGGGVPVIGARRGGIPELVGEGTGWIFEPDESGSLARVMAQAIESSGKLAEMSERAVNWARGFSMEAMLSGYLQSFSRATIKARQESMECSAAPRKGSAA